MIETILKTIEHDSATGPRLVHMYTENNMLTVESKWEGAEVFKRLELRKYGGGITFMIAEIKQKRMHEQSIDVPLSHLDKLIVALIHLKRQTENL